MKSRYYDVAYVKEVLHSPVPSITPQFFKNGEIDWKTTAVVLEKMIAGGAKALLITYGDSLLHILSDQEIIELHRFVTQVSNGRATVIGCSTTWNHKQMVEYAQQCKQIGCDIMMPFYPNWFGGLDNNAVAACVKELGQIMPVMLLSCMMDGGIPLAVLDQLSSNDGWVAIKDDVGQPYGKNIFSHIRDKVAYLSGGRAFNFLDTAAYGADGYLSVYARMYPQVSNAFWNAYTAGNMKEAVELVEKYDVALFADFMAKYKLNFSAVIQGMYEVAGLGQRWRRAPYSSLSDSQMELLRQFLAERGLASS